MDGDRIATNTPTWHDDAVTGAVRATLADLHALTLLQSFYLAGGTALALWFGHRRSVDLDFFSGHGFDPDDLLAALLDFDHLAVVSKSQSTLHVTIAGVKVSFLAYPYPVLFPVASFQGAAVADPRDIASMKLSAIAGRGTKRDFIDLYEAAQHLGGLGAILGWFSRKYTAAHYSRPHLLKSLVFFQDAEQDPMPDMLVRVDWAAVKEFFAAEAPRLL